MAVTVVMPKMGLTMEEGTILKWYKAEGETVNKDELLLDIMTDKATMEVNAPGSGILARIMVPAGDKVKVGTTIGLITAFGEDLVVGEEDQAVPAASVSEAAHSNEGGFIAGVRESRPELEKPLYADEWVKASPAARRLAREKGLSLQSIIGSGPEGRIVEKDVISTFMTVDRARPALASPVAARLAADRGVELSSVNGSGVHGKVMKEDVLKLLKERDQRSGNDDMEVIPFMGMRKIIAERMTESAFTAPHVTIMREADVSGLVEMKSRLQAALAECAESLQLSYTVLITSLVARVLTEFPQVNSRLEPGGIRRLPYINIGIAVGLEEGLVVPVIRDASSLSLEELSRQTGDLINRARSGRLLPEEMQGGTFTISNLGSYKIDLFTPIINQPESAILGLGRMVKKAVVENDAVVFRPMMYFSLSFDHRLIDGVPASLFLDRLIKYINEPLLMLV